MPIVKRTMLALLAGVVVGCVLGPAIYYVKTAPQRAAMLSLATEAEADLKRTVSTETFTKRDYEEIVELSRAREKRYKQVIAEKIQIRSGARQIAIVSGIVTSAGVFGSLFWLSKRRKSSIESKPEPGPSG